MAERPVTAESLLMGALLARARAAECPVRDTHGKRSYTCQGCGWRQGMDDGQMVDMILEGMTRG